MKTEGSLVEKLCRVKDKVGAVAKNDANTQGRGYMFRGIDAVVNAVSPALIDEGIVVYPQLVSTETSLITYGQNSTTGVQTIVVVDYTFTDGETKLTTRVVGGAIDSGDKSQPKAMSVAFRTALLQALTLPTNERDPDADTFDVTDAEGARKAALDSAFAALKAADLTKDQRAALINQAIGREMEGSFADLSLNDAQAVLWAAEDDRVLAALKHGAEPGTDDTTS